MHVCNPFIIIVTTGVIVLTFQQIKTIVAYLLVGDLVFLVYSHVKWPETDLAIPLFILLIVLFIIYLYLDQIKETTLCLIVKDGKVLMMHRNKKANDVHLNKYNGLGGKLERSESKVKGMLREVKEEANVVLTDYHYVGKIRFKNFGDVPTEVMYCFVAYDYEGEIATDCEEGELVWINCEEVLSLPLWEGDQYFIMDIIQNNKFKGFIQYDQDRVVDYHFKHLTPK